MKTCNKCELELPIAFFRRHGTSQDGRVKACKMCARPNASKPQSAYQKLLEANPEQNVRLTDDRGITEDLIKISAAPGLGSWMERQKALQKYEESTGISVNEVLKEEQDKKNFRGAAYFDEKHDPSQYYRRNKFKGKHET